MLGSLIDPIVELMIIYNIMVYCIQEKWVVENKETLARGYMTFMYNRERKVEGMKGRIHGVAAIILSPSLIEAWKAAGSNPPIMTPLE